jgi:hypothetical protein
VLTLWNIIRLRGRVFFGTVFNLAGFPGFVRNCEYKATVADVQIRVRVGKMFTVITINGLDVYFHRLTGKIDGVGLTAGCTILQAPGAMSSPIRPDIAPPLSRM